MNDSVHEKQELLGFETGVSKQGGAQSAQQFLAESDPVDGWVFLKSADDRGDKSEEGLLEIDVLSEHLKSGNCLLGLGLLDLYLLHVFKSAISTSVGGEKLLQELLSKHLNDVGRDVSRNKQLFLVKLREQEVDCEDEGMKLVPCLLKLVLKLLEDHS